MTTKSAIVRARVKPNVKIKAQRVLANLGLSISEAINLLLIQIDIKKALPFGIEIPNEKTRKILDDSEQGKGMNKCKDLNDFYSQLDIED